MYPNHEEGPHTQLQRKQDEFDIILDSDGKDLPPQRQQQDAESQKDRLVEMNLRLNMDFLAAGREDSIQRRNFIKDLKQDLADASGTGTLCFNILKVSPGSVVVDLHAPENAAQEIYRQSLDSNSRLRKGKVTRFTDKITLSDKMTLPTPFKNSSPFEGDEDKFDTKMKLQRLEAELLKIMNSPTMRSETSFPQITQNGVRKPPSPNPDHQEEHHQEKHQLQRLQDEVDTILKNRTAFSDQDERQLQRLQDELETIFSPHQPHTHTRAHTHTHTHTHTLTIVSMNHFKMEDAAVAGDRSDGAVGGLGEDGLLPIVPGGPGGDNITEYWARRSPTRSRPSPKRPSIGEQYLI
jgi:hypothetical protein